MHQALHRQTPQSDQSNRPANGRKANESRPAGRSFTRTQINVYSLHSRHSRNQFKVQVFGKLGRQEAFKLGFTVADIDPKSALWGKCESAWPGKGRRKPNLQIRRLLVQNVAGLWTETHRQDTLRVFTIKRTCILGWQTGLGVFYPSKEVLQEGL